MATTTQRTKIEPDEVISELHRVKEQLAAQYDCDVRRIVAALREEQAKSDRKVVSFAKKRD